MDQILLNQDHRHFFFREIIAIEYIFRSIVGAGLKM
jgi:hypothetical protein